MSASTLLPAIKKETAANIMLMIPLALTQLASASLGITSIVIMGWSGATVLAAGTLAVHFFTFFNVFVGGLLTSASPLIAHSIGAGDQERAKRVAGQAIIIALSLGICGTVIAWHTPDFLELIGQPKELTAIAGPFAKANSLSFIPAILLLVYRNYGAAVGYPRLGLATIVVGIIVNAIVGYGTMFGRFGFPEYGLVGLGYTTASVNLLMFLILFALIQSRKDIALKFRHLLGREHFKSLWKIGIPIGLSGLGSVGTFVAVTFAIALMGNDQVVGHAIGLQAANVGFAILWGGAQATTIRIGRATGARNQQATEIAAWTGVTNGIAVAIMLATVFLIFRYQIVGLFLDHEIASNAASIESALAIMLAVAIYQVANGPQLVATSSLRGMRDTTVPFLISLTGYWVVGSAIATSLVMFTDLLANGIWFGMSAAVGISSTILFYRLRKLLPKALELTAD